MVRSVDPGQPWRLSPWRRRLCACLAGAGTVVALAGCATTQQQAARLQLNAARIRAAERPTVVRDAGSAVEVSDVAMLTTPTGHTFVVTVHNPRASAVTDLPISVGVRVGGHRRVYLNAHSPQELSYFDAHLPRIAADATAMWVFSTARSVPARARAFALVGARSSPGTAAGATAPAIHASVTGTKIASRARAWVEVRLRNDSGIPQYQLPVDAVAVRGHRVIGAGERTVAQLSSGATRTIRVPVHGSISRARIEVAALPAIVR